MKICFWPEGRLLHTQENLSHCASLETLRSAMRQETILEGTATICGPSHDLTVQLGAFTGIVPREEGAIGIAEGTTRDVALLTRVGQPVSVIITQINDDGTLLLSRRQAQEKARLYLMEHLRPGDILPATVTHMEPFGVFVDIGCGLPSMLGIETLSIARVQHPSQRFSKGQEVFAVVSGIDQQGRVTLSHKELLGTWLENAERFRPGMTVIGIVRGVKEYGVFIELAPNLSGLAETQLDLAENDRVSVYIRSILPDRMKLKLSAIQKLPPSSEPPTLSYYMTEGHIRRWQYAPPGCGKIGPVSVFSDQDRAPCPLILSQ